MSQVERVRLDFCEDPRPAHEKMKKNQKNLTNLSLTLRRKVDGEEIQTLLRKDVVCEAEPETGQFLSNVFHQETKDGTVRMILNLNN